MFRIFFLKANLVANASAGSAGHGGGPLAAVVVVIILLWLLIVCFLLLLLFFFLLFFFSSSSSCCCCCCCCCYLFTQFLVEIPLESFVFLARVLLHIFFGRYVSSKPFLVENVSSENV